VEPVLLRGEPASLNVTDTRITQIEERMRPYPRLTDAAKARVLQELAQKFVLNNLRPAGGTTATDCHTLQLDTGRKVRLIGVDTPETKDPRKPVQHFGQEATAFTQRLIEGKRVRLAYDQQHKDKYGRTLAYVYLDDGTFVNA
jgi:endonuclease YncB( thermonuclease family)